MKSTMPLRADQIEVGDKLLERVSGRSATVTDTTDLDIAWCTTFDGMGEFGECGRSMAADIFSNVVSRTSEMSALRSAELLSKNTKRRK